MPAVRLIALNNVFGEGEFRVTIDRDMVVIIERNQFTQFQVAIDKDDMMC